MTELQIGVVGLGVVAVFGVVVYNTWQEYRHRKLAQQVLKQPQDDALLGEAPGAVREPEISIDRFTVQGEDVVVADMPVPPRSEAPVLDDAAEDVLAPGETRIEPVLHFAPDEVPEPVAPPPSLSVAMPAAPELSPPAPLLQEEVPARENRVVPEPLHFFSPLMDYVAAFETVEATPAHQLLESQRETLARIRKPVYWLGFNEASREWEQVIDTGRNAYRSLRVGLQMVDRRGAVVDNDVALFHLAMNELADELMAIVDMPASQAALDRAAELDQFCASVDIQIGINLINEGQLFPGTKIRALAEAAGMVIDSAGRFVRCDEEGNVLYLLLNQEASGFAAETMRSMTTRGMTFLLDVPRVAHGERVFVQMIEQARKFAEVLRGAMVDDNRRPLSEQSLEPIRRQIGQYQAAMAAQQFPAGSPLALRLFS